MVDLLPKQRILLLQGGGALGAYECGAFKALEEKGIPFQVVIGVSIGAINGAIIAGNKEGRRARALEAFWRESSVPVSPYVPPPLRRTAAAVSALMFGNPRLFRPWWSVLGGLDVQARWTSFYDVRPMRSMVEKYVDFDVLGKRETRLLLAAVNVQTGRLELFDSFHQDITPDHVLASGSLPPGLPWTMVDGKEYWDGALVSNTPLSQAMEVMANECSLTGRARVPELEVYLVDLFPGEGHLPASIPEVLERSKDILYSAKIESDIHQCEMMSRTFSLIDDMLSRLPAEAVEEIQRDPRFLELLCHTCPVAVVRISHKGEGQDEYHFKDIDFSSGSVERHIQAGYLDALEILKGPGLSRKPVESSE